MKYKVGDKVKVIANRSNHGFNIGEVVIVTSLESDGSIETAANDYTDWHIDNIEVLPLNVSSDQPKEKSLRYNSGKASIFDTPLLGVTEVAKVAMYGRSKYNEFNWKKETNATELLDCIFRHFIKVMYGLDNASDSKCKEMAHLAWNALAYLEKEAIGTLIDDRHKYPKERIEALETLLMLSDEQKEVNKAEAEKKEKK